MQDTKANRDMMLRLEDEACSTQRFIEVNYPAAAEVLERNFVKSEEVVRQFLTERIPAGTEVMFDGWSWRQRVKAAWAMVVRGRFKTVRKVGYLKEDLKATAEDIRICGKCYGYMTPRWALDPDATRFLVGMRHKRDEEGIITHSYACLNPDCEYGMQNRL